MKKFTSNLQRILLTSVSMLLVQTTLSAQESVQPELEEDAIELSPFVVSTTDDAGYYAANSTAGTSLNAKIRDIPINLSVVTTEFMNDLQATDMKESLAYEAGVFFNTYENTSSANSSSRLADRSPSSNVNVNDPFANTIVIRGYPVPNQQRLGFRVGAGIAKYGVTLGGFTDSVNSERLEVVKGPQSLLYGINVLSGVVNILPKRPLSEPRTELRLGVGSEGFLRGSIDNTGPVIKDQLDYRVVGSYTEEDDWTDYQSDRKEYSAFQLDYHPSRKINIFLEAQYGTSTRNGGGTQYFTDTLNGRNDAAFKNKYGESYTFGYDYFNEDIVTGDGLENELDVNLEPILGNTKLVERPGDTYLFPALGDTYRISGPDVFREQEEYDLLAVVRLQPIENLDIELGAYYTHVDVLKRDVDLAIINNSLDSINDSALRMNPEADLTDIRADGTTNTLGIGEYFQSYNPFTQPGENVLNNDFKIARTMWYESPSSSESIQLRGRIAYTIETDWFSGRMKGMHTFTGGVSYTKDEISFVQGGPSNNANFSLKGGSPNFIGNEFGNDPIQLRSIFDYSVIRYEGEKMAIPGYMSWADLGPITQKDYLGRSGFKEAELTFTGQYAIYYGRFFDNKLHVMAGLRKDTYQVLEREQLRVLDPLQASGLWQGTLPSVLPILVGYGDQPYTWRTDLPDYINAGVEADIERLMAVNPNGTAQYMFEEDEEYTTGSFGLSYHLTDDLSVFFNYAEGIFPNSGQRDGNYEAISAEQTISREIGVKFELFESKLSGTIGVYQIERKNAVFDWKFAPNPSKWGGGPLDYTGSAQFKPDDLRDGTAAIQYGVALPFAEKALTDAGKSIIYRTGRPPTPANINITEMKKLYPELVSGSVQPTDSSIDTNEETFYFFVDYDQLEGSPFKAALDSAVSGVKMDGVTGLPIRYFGALEDAYNSSRAFGANVLYEEEGFGVDGSLIFSPWSDNRYQLMFGYSYTKREVVGSGFQLASGYQIDDKGTQVDDELFTTEYDLWVYLLGPENFEDPKDPTTLKASAVNGVDLSFVPNWNLTLWNKYTFQEGWMKDISVGGGVRWTSSVPTTTGVGGDNIDENLYPTPDVPERFVWDLSLSYRREIWEADWTFSLKVANLFDNNVGEDIATYSDDSGNTILRRTRILYEPRNLRASVSVAF